MKRGLLTSAAPAAPARALTHQLLRLWPGAGIAALIAIAASSVSSVHGGPQLLYALFFGVAFHYLSADPKTQPGIEFCSRTVLRVGVGLLGARITAGQIASLGWSSALIILAGVVTTLALGPLLARRFGLSRAQGVLAGGSVAICGASAALAISAVLPRETRREGSCEGERFTLMVVVTVTVMSTVAMVVYPLVARLLHLSPEMAGLFLGGTIHDVAQVVGAGYTLSHQAGDAATVVKLFRVSLLAVVVLGVGWAFKGARARASAESGQTAARQPLVPWFLWLFVLMVAVNSAGALPQAVQSALNTGSRACLVLAIAALGVKTSFAELAQAGWRPLALILIETVWLAGLVLTGVWLRSG